MTFEFILLAILGTCSASIFSIIFSRSVLFAHTIVFSLTVLLPSTIAYTQFSRLADSYLAVIFALLYLPVFLLAYASYRGQSSSERYSILTAYRNHRLFGNSVLLLSCIFVAWFVINFAKSPLSSLYYNLAHPGYQLTNSEVLRSTLLKETGTIPFLRSVAVAAWDILSPLIPISCINFYTKFRKRTRCRVIFIFSVCLLCTLSGLIVSLYFGERYSVVRYFGAFLLVFYWLAFLRVTNRFRLLRLRLIIKTRGATRIIVFIFSLLLLILSLPLIHLLTYSQASLSTKWLSSYIDNIFNILFERIGTGQVVELFHRFDYANIHGFLLGRGLPIPLLHYLNLPSEFINPNSLIHSEYSASVINVVGGAPAIWYGDIYLNFGIASILFVFIFGLFAAHLDNILTSLSSSPSPSGFFSYYPLFLYVSWSLYFVDLSLGFIPVYHDFRFFILIFYTLLSRYVII
jgi:hypothetical protein